MGNLNGSGYIVIANWEAYQHHDAIRSGPPMKWQKMHTAQLDNDDYMELKPSERALLHDLRMLTARTGQGRCSASPAHLQRLLNIPDRYTPARLERLIQAGFISISAHKLPAENGQTAGSESREYSDETTSGGSSSSSSTQKKTRASARTKRRPTDADTDGHRREETYEEEKNRVAVEREEGRRLAQEALSQLQAQELKPLDPAPPVADDDELI